MRGSGGVAQVTWLPGDCTAGCCPSAGQRRCGTSAQETGHSHGTPRSLPPPPSYPPAHPPPDKRTSMNICPNPATPTQRHPTHPVLIQDGALVVFIEAVVQLSCGEHSQILLFRCRGHLGEGGISPSCARSPTFTKVSPVRLESSFPRVVFPTPGVPANTHSLSRGLDQSLLLMEAFGAL